MKMNTKLTLEETKKIMEKYGGSMYLSGIGITSLPDSLKVKGDLDLENCKGITMLPKNLEVGGSLDLRGTEITCLPENLTVGGALDLRGTKITALPKNLTVGGWLDLRRTKITSLPENLTVGGDLDVCGLKITSLPKNLKVGGNIFGLNSYLANFVKVKNYKIEIKVNCGKGIESRFLSVKTSNTRENVGNNISRAEEVLNSGAWCEYNSYEEYCEDYPNSSITREEFDDMEECFAGYDEDTFATYLEVRYGYEVQKVKSDCDFSVTII